MGHPSKTAANRLLFAERRLCGCGMTFLVQQIVVCLQSDVHAAANRCLFAGRLLLGCEAKFMRQQIAICLSGNTAQQAFLLQLRSEIPASASRNARTPQFQQSQPDWAVARGPRLQSGIVQPAFARLSKLSTKPLACRTPSSIPLHPHNNRPHGLSVRRTASAAIGARLIARSRKRTAGQAPADDFPSLRLLSPADCGFAQKDGGFPPTPARP